MESAIYRCRKCGHVLKDPASPEDDTTRAVGWCVCSGTWGWGDRERAPVPQGEERRHLPTDSQPISRPDPSPG